MDISLANDRIEHLCSIGEDTPERGVRFYREATNANRSLVEGQSVQLVQDVSATDRFGRLLRYVYLPEGIFGRGLRNGHQLGYFSGLCPFKIFLPLLFAPAEPIIVPAGQSDRER
jgi:hypothetical protein